MYKELENNANQAYWEDVQTIVLDELNKLRRLAAPDARRDGVHQAVADDVTQVRKLILTLAITQLLHFSFRPKH